MATPRGRPICRPGAQGGVQNSIFVPSTLVSGTTGKQSVFRPSEKQCPTPIRTGHVGEEGHRASNQQLFRGLLLKTVSGTQEDRGMASSHRFVGTQQICRVPDIQDGHARARESQPSTWNVGNIHRLEGCLLPHSHPPQTQEVPSLPGPGEGFSVFGAPLWFEHGSASVHQSGGTTEENGNKDGHLAPPVYRRLAEQGTVRGRCGSQDSTTATTDRRVGLDSESRQIRPHTDTGIRVPVLQIRSSQGFGISNGTKVSEVNSATVSVASQCLNNSSQCYEGIRSHGSNFQAGPIGSPAYETSTAGSCTAVGLEGSSGFFHHHSTSSAGTHSMVDHQRQCYGGCTTTPTSAVDGGLHGCVYGGVGSTLLLPHRAGQLVCPRAQPPHKCLRVESSFQCSKGVCGLPHKQTCSCSYRQHDCCSLHKQTGRHSFMGTMCSTVASPGMVSAKEHCSNCTAYTRLPKCHCRPAVPQGSSSPHGVVFASRHFSADMSAVGYSNDRPLRNSFQQQVATVCVASPRPHVSGGGCVVDGLGGEIPVCLSSDGCHSSGHEQAAVLTGLQATLDRSLLADQAMVLGPKKTVVSSSLAVTTSLVSAQATTSAGIPQEHSSAGSPRMVVAGGLDDIDRDIQERIDNPQRQSTRLVYSGKWEIFQKWCDDHEVASMQPTVMNLSRFFLYLFKDKGLQPGTIQGYRSALANKLYNKVQWDISHDPSLTRLMDSFFRDRPVIGRALPPWDLRVVLQSLTQAPFEPLALAPLKWLTFKTCFLVTLASGKRRSEVHALLHSRLRTDDNWSKVIIEPSNRFIAKNQLARDGTAVLQPIILRSLSDTLSGDLVDDRSLCPVRALRYYLDRTKDLRRDRELLFISHRSSHKTEIHKNTISSWLVQTIRACLHNCSDNTAALCRVKAHDIRALAASWTFKSGVALHDVMKACSWKAHNTFTSFYLKDVSLSNPEGKISLGPVAIAQQIVHL